MPISKVVWRWILVIPAFLAGALIVPILFHLIWELGILVIPDFDFLISLIEILKSAIGGFCGVWLAKAAAPSHTKSVGIGIAALTVAILGYLSLLGVDNFSTFERWNFLIMAVAAVIAIKIPAYDEIN